ncbi:hypothetical protein RhiirA4_475414 [Rhizophagus irregularis]|uniref:Uncharacterized protein n=1 Tax=Rhizophagus irregularis TaxID=588596 RepID=A0A2I1HA42_9GLOM|nr:hypothetical protein RhiirA4_475414 [Rhizophagus irregularis]
MSFGHFKNFQERFLRTSFLDFQARVLWAGKRLDYLLDFQERLIKIFRREFELRIIGGF